MDWKTSYIDALIEKLNPKGEVLQVGFDKTAAEKIHKNAEKHVLIADSSEAKAWAEGKSVLLHETSWQEVLPTLSSFDAIYFHIDFIEEMPSLFQENETILSIKKNFPQIETIQYKTEDLELLCETFSEEKAKELANFLLELEKNEQISKEQRGNLFEKYDLKKEADVFDFRNQNDPALQFFSHAKKHLKKEGRFTCTLLDQRSRYDDPGFFEAVITDEEISYEEESLKIKDSPYGSMLLPLIEKVT